jgi:tRNA G10  N-methylase Trm11
MALMFQRLARNFIKNGYFPTDSATLARTLQALAPAENGHLRILDPCCGEGVALAECKHHLGTERTEAFGVEYDEERAWHAKQLLDRCIHGDAQDCILGRKQFGLLWLNPPYGDLVADKARTSRYKGKGRPRLEKLFYSLSQPWLAFGGVMVLIIPAIPWMRNFATGSPPTSSGAAPTRRQRIAFSRW